MEGDLERAVMKAVNLKNAIEVVNRTIGIIEKRRDEQIDQYDEAIKDIPVGTYLIDGALWRRTASWEAQPDSFHKISEKVVVIKPQEVI